MIGTPYEFPNIPEDMRDAWPWVIAIDAWDYCDANELTNLLRTQEIPVPLRPVIADIVSGDRKQNKKAAAKLRIPTSERMKIAGTISTIVGLMQIIRCDIIDDDYPGQQGAEMLSDRLGQEPSQIVAELNEELRKLISEAASDLNVSTETIENLLRSFREKVKNWPCV